MNFRKIYKGLRGVICGAVLGMIVSTGYAQTVPNVITFQSVLFDDSGNVLTDDSTDILFRILDDQDNEIYSEEQAGIQVFDGMINVLLGSGIVPNTEPSTPTGGLDWQGFDPSQSLFLEVTVGNVTTLDPLELTSMPYAFYAQQAMSMPDGSITSAMIADGAINSTHLENIDITEIMGTIDITQLPDEATTDTELSTAISGLQTQIDGNDTDIANHLGDTGNPHSVTIGQIGAASSSHNHDSRYVNDSGDTMSGNLNMGNNDITNVDEVDGVDVSAVSANHESRISALEGDQVSEGEIEDRLIPRAYGTVSTGGVEGNSYRLSGVSVISCGAHNGLQVNFSSSLGTSLYTVLVTPITSNSNISANVRQRSSGNVQICPTAAFAGSYSLLIFYN